MTLFQRLMLGDPLARPLFEGEDEGGAGGGEGGDGGDGAAGGGAKGGEGAGGAKGGGEGAGARTALEGAQGGDGGEGEGAGGGQVEWRQRMSGGDAETLKLLGRYASEADVGKALIEQRKKISQGAQPVLPPGAGASEDEVKAYREAAGIPETAADLELDFGEGVVIGDADKPIIDSFKQGAHAANLTAQQASQMSQWYFQAVDQIAADELQADRAAKEETEEALIGELGADYKPFMRRIDAFLQSQEGGKDFAKQILGARLLDGSMLGNNVQALKWLGALALEANPLSTFDIKGGGDPAKSIETELGEISTLRKNNDPEYQKNKQKYRERERELLEARQKLNK